MFDILFDETSVTPIISIQIIWSSHIRTFKDAISITTSPSLPRCLAAFVVALGSTPSVNSARYVVWNRQDAKPSEGHHWQIRWPENRTLGETKPKMAIPYTSDQIHHVSSIKWPLLHQKKTKYSNPPHPMAWIRAGNWRDVGKILWNHHYKSHLPPRNRVRFMKIPDGSILPSSQCLPCLWHKASQWQPATEVKTFDASTWEA